MYKIYHEKLKKYFCATWNGAPVYDFAYFAINFADVDAAIAQITLLKNNYSEKHLTSASETRVGRISAPVIITDPKNPYDLRAWRGYRLHDTSQAEMDAVELDIIEKNKQKAIETAKNAKK